MIVKLKSGALVFTAQNEILVEELYFYGVLVSKVIRPLSSGRAQARLAWAEEKERNRLKFAGV